MKAMEDIINQVPKEAFKETMESMTYADIIECLEALDGIAETQVRLNFIVREQCKFNNIALRAMIDYLGLYIKAFAEKTGYTFDEERYVDDFVNFLEKRLGPYNKMVEEHQNVLENL